jgi:hypothetical protein
MQNFISTQLFGKQVEISCSPVVDTERFVGLIDQVIGDVLVLENKGEKLYLSISKIVSIREI